MKTLLHLVAISLLWFSTAAHAATYQIDGAHSTAGFTVRHMMVSNVSGAFTKMSGTVDWDPANPLQSKVDVTIEAASVNTRNEGRDKHLRSADFFDTDNHPSITFKSKRVDKASDGHLRLVGDLTLRGVTKEVVLDVEGPTPEVLTQGAYRVGATATTRINRKDFGVNYSRAMDNGGVVVSDEVRINIDVELVRKAPPAS
jgi:polyisoprenoid-binding protein YceI